MKPITISLAFVALLAGGCVPSPQRTPTEVRSANDVRIEVGPRPQPQSDAQEKETEASDSEAAILPESADAVGQIKALELRHLRGQCVQAGAVTLKVEVFS